MKRIIAAAAVLLMLMCMAAASAGSAGSPDDPLISLSYLTGDFAGSMRDAAAEKLKTAMDDALARLNELYMGHVGYSFAPRFTPISLRQGNTVSLATGSSFVLLSGSVSLSITSGSVVNTATGFEVAPDSLLAYNQRYFCAENASVVITAAADSACQVDGYYITDGTLTPVIINIFKDVKNTDWFYPAVSFVYAEGLFAGTSADTFSPGTAMTRAMFVTVLHRLDGLPEAWTPIGFSDVTDTSQYYYNAVLWASSNNIVNGYDDGSFRPNDSITREQMAAIIYRYAAYRQLDLLPSGTAYEAFPDKASVSAYAADAMRWAVSRGIINGSEGKLLPLNTATRAQVAQIILNYCENAAH